MSIPREVLGERRHVWRKSTWFGRIVDRDDEEARHGFDAQTGLNA
jgi:hypothetical protein